MKNFRTPLRFYSWCSTRGAHGNLAQSYPAHVAPPGNREPFRVRFRACLKNHFRNLQAPLCGIFYPHSVAVARYAALIRIKSPTNWDSQLTKSLFQTRSRMCLGASSRSVFYFTGKQFPVKQKAVASGTLTSFEGDSLFMFYKLILRFFCLLTQRVTAKNHTAIAISFASGRF